MNWQPFVDGNGKSFSLRHLHPINVTYRLPPTIMRPATDVVVRVTYGLHCFTRDAKAGEAIDPAQIYFSNHENRLFCPERWELGQGLPRIIDSILERSCFETDRRNHVMFSSVKNEKGEEYAVFFALRGASYGNPWSATLLVISAHSRNGFPKRGKPKKFRELLRATL